jgi:hypothetical protein
VALRKFIRRGDGFGRSEMNVATLLHAEIGGGSDEEQALLQQGWWPIRFAEQKKSRVV